MWYYKIKNDAWWKRQDDSGFLGLFVFFEFHASIDRYGCLISAGEGGKQSIGIAGIIFSRSMS